MSYTILLDKHTAPLDRLTLVRLQLDASCPSLVLGTQGNEGLLYSLVGRVTVYADGLCLGTLGGRRSVTEPQIHCIRFPAGVMTTITVVLDGFAADVLWVTYESSSFKVVATPYSRVTYNQGTSTNMTSVIQQTPYLHWHDTVWHSVGTGTYARTVAEVPRPDGYRLDVGETLNPPGAWSSYPPHANTQDIEHFSNGETTWEEVFFCVCEQPGIVNLQGVYTGGTIVEKVMPVYNGHAYVMPLGSHAMVAHPQSYLYYFWCYAGTALEKIYRKYSDDVGVYRK